MPIQRNLMSLAILKVNWAGRLDYVENFVPFAAQALKISKQPEVSLQEIQNIFETEFGLTIPQGPLKTILKRAKKRGYLSVSNGIYKRNEMMLEKLNFSVTQQGVERKHNTLIDRLIHFCQDKNGEVWTVDEAEMAMQEYLADEGHRIMNLRTEADISADVHTSTKNNYIVASFVCNLHERDVAGFEYLMTVVKGAMLADAVYFPEIGSVKSTFGNLDVYFDTNFLLRAMGYAPKAKQDPCLELLDLLHELNANLKCFTHTFEEIRGVLLAAAHYLRNDGKGVVGTFETYEYFAGEGCSASDVDLIVAKLSKSLSSLRVHIVETPPHSPPLTIDESAFGDMLQTKYGFIKEESRYKDIRSVTAVYRLRDGQKYYNIDSCKAIFVTTNSDLARATIEFFNIAENGEVPLCLPDYVLATHAWLMKPTSAPDLPRKRLIADCYAALNPTDELWGRYLRELEKLQQSKDVSAEDYALLRYSSVARTALMDTVCGDPEVFVEGTIKDILEKAKMTIRADLEEEVTDKQQLLEQANQQVETEKKRLQAQRQHIRSCSVRIGKYFSLFVGALMIVMLVFCMVITFPGIPNHFSKKPVIFIVLVLFSIWMIVSVVYGTSVKSFMRKIERWVSDRCETMMLDRSTDNETTGKPPVQPPVTEQTE